MMKEIPAVTYMSLGMLVGPKNFGTHFLLLIFGAKTPETSREI